MFEPFENRGLSALCFQLVSSADDLFELKNILCIPIMDGDGHVIGVCQMMNKLHGGIFTDDDVAIIEVSFIERTDG